MHQAFKPSMALLHAALHISGFWKQASLIYIVFIIASLESVSAGADSNSTFVSIAGSCGVRGSLYADDGRMQYEVWNNDAWTRVVSLSPEYLKEQTSSGADVAQGPNQAYAHSFGQLTHEKWSLSPITEISATSLNDGREKFPQIDGALRLLRVSFSRNFVSDSNLGSRVAGASMEHFLVLNQGWWVDQAHGAR
jgi:hypothetical protein